MCSVSVGVTVRVRVMQEHKYYKQFYFSLHVQRVNMAYRLPFMTGCHHKNGCIALGRVPHTVTLHQTPPHAHRPTPHNLLWKNVDQIGDRARSPPPTNNRRQI